MVAIIEPKVHVVGFGPHLVLENGQEITTDEFVYGAAAITYKDVGTVREMIEMKQKDEDIAETVRKSLIKSAGSGHASMATTPGFWIYLEGNCSKAVDSIFTGARFSSSLMPSGRRIPVVKEQIVVPRGLHDKGNGLENLYIKASEANIDAYEKLQEQGVPKEEAAKIVQYGHRGGGFIFMPLETLISFSRNADGNLMPREGREIIKHLEEFIHSHGMSVTYEARKAAPRTGCPNPNIFHDRKNLAQELVDRNYKGALNHPVLLSETEISSNERDKRIGEYLARRTQAFRTLEGVEQNWQSALRELELIVEDFNDSVSVKTIANSPLRVWGEVKRHRTLPQTTESVYHAVDRALDVLRYSTQTGNLETLSNLFFNVVSIPPSVKQDPEKLRLWLDRFKDSIQVYDELVQSGVDKSDAILVVPRGLKLGIVKTYDLYNLTTGYMSLRLCKTAEAEMRSTTLAEKKLVLDSGLSQPIKSLIDPKCHYVGFCPDNNCGIVKGCTPEYNDDFHKRMKKVLEADIRGKL